MNIHETLLRDCAQDPEKAVEHLKALAAELQTAFPKLLVVVGSYRGAAQLDQTLRRIPASLIPLIEEIAVFGLFSEDFSEGSSDELKGNPAWGKLRYCRIPRQYQYGENLKNCFDYAIEKGFDYVAVLRGDATYDPASLPLLFLSALMTKSPAVIGDRMNSIAPGKSRESGKLLRRWANRILSRVEEFILRMRLRDYHCGYRLLSTEVLKRIPYSLNVGDYLFDLQLLIQLRCLGIAICTAPVPDFHDMTVRAGEAARLAWRAIKVAIGYRLHQLHIIRRAVYFVDLGERYTLKRNRYSSHMQILDALKPGSTVLDIGCGRSLLAEEYASRGITVIGVDNIPAEQVSRFVHAYVRQDLEMPLELPYGRIFDYVILSDVIEHITNRDALMNTLRGHLKTDGVLIASTGNIAIWFYRVSLLLGRFEYGPRGILDRTHVHLFTLDSFQRFFRQEGYRLLEVKYTPIPFELVFSSTGRSSLVESITHWYYRATCLWPRLFAYQFIVSCTFRSYESAKGEELWQPTVEE
jgi:2-polyprenyl-3-methyl-5-hydroxy-6-metoxy-1,4-benzoquinol methylase